MFKVSAPSEARGNTVTAREILDRSSNDIERELDRDPSPVRADAGDGQRPTKTSASFPVPMTLMERVLQERSGRLGADDPKTLEAMAQMGWLLYREGHDAEAERLIRLNIDAQSRILGPEIPQPSSPRVVLSESCSASALCPGGETRTGVDHDQYPPARSRESTRCCDSWMDWPCIERRKPLCEAEAEYRQLLDLERRILGADHPDTLSTVHDLATMFLVSGNYQEAEKLYRENLQIRETRPGTGTSGYRKLDDDAR